MSSIIHTLHLDLTMKLIGELSKVDRFDASWTSIEKREGATLKQLKTFATVRSVGASTRIEGSRMTDAEVERLINRIEVGHFEERDQQEVAGYFEALDSISENYRDIRVSESHIKNLHQILMKHSEKDAWHRGKYKQHSNSVDETHSDGTKRTIFETTPPGFPTEDAMRQLIEWYNSDKDTIPVIKIAVFVYEFLSIHPFQDGNGRMSRLLGTLLLLKSGYSWIQYVSFEHEIENRKKEYYRVLMQTQRERPGENVSDWTHFFVDCLLRIQGQLELKLKSRRSSNIFNQKEKNIIAFIENRPGSRSGEIAEKLGIPLPTVKKILTELSQNRYIEKQGIGKGTSYFIAMNAPVMRDRQFILTNKDNRKEFMLHTTSHFIEIKQIILQPHFNWKTADEWATVLNRQHPGITVTLEMDNGSKYSQYYSIAGMNNPYLYQPVFTLEPHILIPNSILFTEPLQSQMPISVQILLESAAGKIDFDVIFVFDALI